MSHIKLYSTDSTIDASYFLNEGTVYFYTSNVDKYAIHGKNLILGSTEIIMKKLLHRETGRIETAIADEKSVVKRMSVDKFLSGLNKFSFSLNVSMVLAKQVSLTNEIIKKNLSSLEGEEKKVRESSTAYYDIISRLKDEYQKRRLPWLRDLFHQYEDSLTFKRGEAFSRSAEPVKIKTSVSSSENENEYPRGTVICEEGSPGDEMYILRSGYIDVMIQGNRVAGIDEPGTVIGEMALLLGEKRAATLKAKNTVVMTRIKKSDLKQGGQDNLNVISGVSLSLAQRHYYNIIKIGSINRSILERNFDETHDSEKKTKQIHRIEKELAALKSNVEDEARAKKADFLDDLVAGF